MKSRLAVLGVAALVAFAGCSGIGSSGTTSPQPTPDTTDVTDTTTPSQTDTTTQEAEPREFQSLSNASQAFAMEAIEDGEATALRTNLNDDLAPGMNWSTLQYQGTVYNVSWEFVGAVAQYKLANGSRVNASEVENTSTVVAYSNLSERAQRLFTDAQTGNESAWYGSETFPDRFQNYRFVEYQGDYYRILVYTGEFEQYRLSATPA
ncbi:hypothetical protein [Salarchaeum japonicum]|uniref:hypothetical protein n=1 Tax=Salarchaeum japonicum TaxID=555573 RepID=UPI003C752843